MNTPLSDPELMPTCEVFSHIKASRRLHILQHGFTEIASGFTLVITMSCSAMYFLWCGIRGMQRLAAIAYWSKRIDLKQLDV